MRDWINAFDPADARTLAAAAGGRHANILWAADVWHSVKRHWVLEAQRFVRARRGTPPPEPPAIADPGEMPARLV